MGSVVAFFLGAPIAGSFGVLVTAVLVAGREDQ